MRRMICSPALHRRAASVAASELYSHTYLPLALLPMVMETCTTACLRTAEECQGKKHHACKDSTVERLEHEQKPQAGLNTDLDGLGGLPVASDVAAECLVAVAQVHVEPVREEEVVVVSVVGPTCTRLIP